MQPIFQLLAIIPSLAKMLPVAESLPPHKKTHSIVIAPKVTELFFILS